MNFSMAKWMISMTIYKMFWVFGMLIMSNFDAKSIVFKLYVGNIFLIIVLSLKVGMKLTDWLFFKKLAEHKTVRK